MATPAPGLRPPWKRARRLAPPRCPAHATPSRAALSTRGACRAPLRAPRHMRRPRRVRAPWARTACVRRGVASAAQARTCRLLLRMYSHMALTTWGRDMLSTPRKACISGESTEPSWADRPPPPPPPPPDFLRGGLALRKRKHRGAPWWWQSCARHGSGGSRAGTACRDECKREGLCAAARTFSWAPPPPPPPLAPPPLLPARRRAPRRPPAEAAPGTPAPAVPSIGVQRVAPVHLLEAAAATRSVRPKGMGAPGRCKVPWGPGGQLIYASTTRLSAAPGRPAGRATGTSSVVHTSSRTSCLRSVKSQPSFSSSCLRSIFSARRGRGAWCVRSRSRARCGAVLRRVAHAASRAASACVGLLHRRDHHCDAPRLW